MGTSWQCVRDQYAVGPSPLRQEGLSQGRHGTRKIWSGRGLLVGVIGERAEELLEIASGDNDAAAEGERRDLASLYAFVG